MRPRSCTGRTVVAALLLVALHTAGCGSPLRWHLARTPSEGTLAAALNEAADPQAGAGGALTAQVPTVPPPVRLRPSCAFGADLRTRVGVMPIPLLAIGNVVGPESIGPHKYDGGMFAMSPGQDPAPAATGASATDSSTPAAAASSTSLTSATTPT